MRTLHPWRGLAGLPREIWILFAATLVNRAGTMALVFLMLYLTRELGWQAQRAGLLVGLYGFGSILGAPIAGRLADRFGVRRIMTTSLLLTGLLLFLVPHLRTGPSLAAAILAWSLASESFRPASLAAVSHLVLPEKRKAAFSAFRLAVNLGMSIGPALGGFLAARSFGLVFAVDGATALAAGTLLLLAPWRADAGTPVRPEAGPAADAHPSAFRNPHLLYFGLVLVPVIIVFFQSTSTMSMYLVRDLGFSTSTYGLLFTVNTLLIVFLEIPLSVRLARRSHPRMLAIGALLVGTGFGMLAFVRDVRSAVASVVVWTLGEMVLLPACNAFVADLAPAHRTGEYMGFYTMIFGLSFVLAPWLGTHWMEWHGAPSLWLTAFGTCVVAAALLARVYSRPVLQPEEAS